MQVIFMVWSKLPPSAWFFPDKPLNFAAIACLVLSLSTAFAWMQNRFWAALLGTSKKQAAPVAMKGDTFDMHARAGVSAM